MRLEAHSLSHWRAPTWAAKYPSARRLRPPVFSLLLLLSSRQWVHRLTLLRPAPSPASVVVPAPGREAPPNRPCGLCVRAPRPSPPCCCCCGLGYAFSSSPTQPSFTYWRSLLCGLSMLTSVFGGVTPPCEISWLQKEFWHCFKFEIRPKEFRISH